MYQAVPSSEELDGTPVEALCEVVGVLAIDQSESGYILTMRGSDFKFMELNCAFDSIRSFAAVGPGPDDYISPRYCGSFDGGYMILDRPTGRLMVEGKVAQSRDTIADFIADFGYEVSYAMALDNCLWGMLESDGGKYFYLDNGSDSLKIVKSTIDDLLIGPEGRNLSQTIACASPDKKMAAALFYGLPLLEIFDDKGQPVSVTQFDLGATVRQILQGETEPLDFYDICATKDAIFALLHTKRLSENSKCQLICFDWQGNVMHSFLIDEAVSITASVDGAALLAVNLDDTKGVLTKYVIP